MAALSTELRKQLEKTIIAARRTAEIGATAALDALAVPHGNPFPHMGPEDRDLRNRLRAHARQLGDRRNPNGTQAIDRLVHECAYEHWHRMLFARFLAENDLLLEPGSGVAVSLEECEELVRDRGIESWELAGQFAQHMLPQIFRPDDPALQLNLPREHRGKLEGLLDVLPADVFWADDSLGWVYQFWQAEKKYQVNRSEAKIGADELPAVTQLFTEDYMVLFLLHNTLGAWWAGKVLAERPKLAYEAESEDELRKACAVGNVTWPYLRFVGEDDGPWRPAAGTFDGWPKPAKEITVIDPCMGSGHFLVFALPILVAFRMAEEGLSREVAIEEVLRDNLFGLEIDSRCTQIAAFNLALAAWRVVGHRPLPRLNLACSGLSLGVTKAEWLKLAERATTAAPMPPGRDVLGSREMLFSARVKTGLDRLYDLFARAPWLGSLIEPHKSGGDVFAAGFTDIQPFLRPILSASAGGGEVAEMAVAAQGMAKAAELLGRRFTLVATNVPYLGRGRQDEVLKVYCGRTYPTAKTDIATCFLERCLAFSHNDGSAALITPQNWLFLGTYKRLREKLLKEQRWNIVARLGPRAFETISGEVVSVSLVTLTHRSPHVTNTFVGFDATDERTPVDKDIALACMKSAVVNQSTQLQNPDNTITLEPPSPYPRLGTVANCNQGIGTADANRFILRFWEVSSVNRATWAFYQMAPERITAVSGCHSLLRWENGSGPLANSAQARICGQPAWGKEGIALAVNKQVYRSRYFGTLFDCTLGALTCTKRDDLASVSAFVFSDEFVESVRKVDQAFSITESSFLKVPFDKEYWIVVSKDAGDHSLFEAETRDPSQWLYSGHPEDSESPLQVAVARLLGYRWPRQNGSSFADCPALDPDGLEKHADADGIVCIPAVRGEEPVADRLGALLATAFGAGWSPTKERQLIAASGSDAESLDGWLRRDFFAQHCALFHHRPFIWHLWDGRKDGFHALVNYHKLAEGHGKGRRLLETLIYSYLGDWISRQKTAVGQGAAGADDRLAASIQLQKELEKIIAGEPPYDTFARWKPLHEQPVGWEPDIDDGVRLNIRPFMSATLSRGRTGAGVLRAKPNIKWQKDRGKEPERDRDDFPWFWNGENFTGERHNGLHFTNAEKQAARQRRGDG